MGFAEEFDRSQTAGERDDAASVRDERDGVRDAAAAARDAAAIDRRLFAAQEQDKMRERIRLASSDRRSPPLRIRPGGSSVDGQVGCEGQLEQTLLECVALIGAFEALSEQFLAFLDAAGVQLELAASDRRESRRDRTNAAHRRDQAADDRHAAAADRFYADALAAQYEINRNQFREPDRNR
jgi:hypothetical protein